MNLRKLASIRQVTDVRPIEGADAIDCAIIDGWEVVIKKNEYAPGDVAIYCEIDSVLPVCEEFEFLRKSSYVHKEWLALPDNQGFRLKTIKLRGQVSQGLLLKLPDHWKLRDTVDTEFGWVESGSDVFVSIGAEVTSLLGIIKWDPPLPPQLVGQAEGLFPTFINKTDQERCQNIPREIRESFARQERYEVTIKLDGTSCTVFTNDGELGVCSRNLQLKMNEANKDNTLIKVARESGLLKALEKYGKNIAVQGELMGPGIQGNRENLAKCDLFVFDIFDIDKSEYVAPGKRLDVMADLAELGYTGKHVPILEADIQLAWETPEQLLLVAEGSSLNNPVREGLVFKRLDGKFSFKAISNRFLLGEK